MKNSARKLDKLGSYDFLALAEKMTRYDVIVLATPVYWYAPSAHMKIFIDRWTDLLTIRKDLGRKLEGKNLFVISAYGTEFSLAVFETPIKMICEYMNINYRGCYFQFSGDFAKADNKNLSEFREKIARVSQ